MLVRVIPRLWSWNHNVVDCCRLGYSKMAALASVRDSVS